MIRFKIKHFINDIKAAYLRHFVLSCDCPNCKANKSHLSIARSITSDTNWVQCEVCNWCGPPKSTMSEAVVCWNMEALMKGD